MTTAITDHGFSMLAREAKRRGVHILIERVTGDHFATDERDPDYLFRVTRRQLQLPLLHQVRSAVCMWPLSMP